MLRNISQFSVLMMASLVFSQSLAFAGSGPQPRTGNSAASTFGATNFEPSNLTSFMQNARVFLGTQPINPVDHPTFGLVVTRGDESPQPTPTSTPTGVDVSQPIYINIAVGTEAEAWFEKAYASMVNAKLNKLQDGRTFFVNIEGKGSISAAQAIVEAERSRVQGKSPGTHYTVWCPAASVYKSLVTDHFRSSPFLSEDPLVNSPVVFVTFDKSQEVITNKYPLVGTGMSLLTIGQIVAGELKQGAGIIKPNGQNFKFGTTDPAQSSTGAILLMMAANEYFETQYHGRAFDKSALSDPNFQGFLALIKGNTQNNVASTETLSSDMSASIATVDSGFMYESSAINVIKTLQKRGKKHVSVRYPKFNFLTDHPYYILATGTTSGEQLAARVFMDYLKSDAMQKMAAVDFNFRPLNPVVDEDTQDDLFKRFAAFGIWPTEKLSDLMLMEPPRRDFIEAITDIYKGVSFQNIF